MPGARPITPGLFTQSTEGPRLLAARCAACGKAHFPAGPVCPYCGVDGVVATPVGPEGRLYLYTAVASAPPGYHGEVPYGFGVVELEGGLRVIARLTEWRLERLRPGLPMHLVVEPLFRDGEGRTVLCYAFRPESA